VLLDADDTLFDFPRASQAALAEVCRDAAIPYTPELHERYHRINMALWGAFDRGEIEKEALLVERYVRFLRELGLDRDPVRCNQVFEEALGRAIFPLPHAEEVCRALAERGRRLYIATNAVAAVQRRRLALCPFASVFAGIFTSEEAGAAKPGRAFYDYIRGKLPAMTAEDTLAVGDSASSDILGANNAGLPCCWLNPAGLPRPRGLRIDYEIRDLRELLEIV